jgi:small subunit ribosomal protein S4
MGDPKKIRKKYNPPRHPWIKAKIESEKLIRLEFGTANKKEIWKMETILKNFKTQAKNLIIGGTKQAEIETQHLFRRVKELGLIKEEVNFDSILGLTLNDIMNRRLQTLVCKKGLARTVKQARQFIVHQHVLVNGKKITSPSYLVSIKDEASLEFTTKSPLYDINHPERVLSQEDLDAKKEIEAESKKTSTKKKPAKIKDILVDDGSDLEDIEEIKGDEK